MSSLADTRLSVLGLINAVLAKLGTSPVSSITDNAYSTTLLQWLNEVVSELDDLGDWEERYNSATVELVVDQDTYSFTTTEPIKRIVQLFYNQNSYELRLVTKEKMNLMKRTTTKGVPTSYCVYGVDSVGNPRIRIYPTPSVGGTNKELELFYYAKTPNLETTDDAVILPYPANVVIKGLYSKALIDQNDGEMSVPVRLAIEEYERSRREALNRFTNDTGRTTRFVPGYSWSNRR